MRLEHAFLAKYADVTADGLCSVIGGGLSAIEVPELPGSCSTIAFVGRVLFDSDDEILGQSLTFRVTDLEGVVADVPIPKPFGDPNKLLRGPGGVVAAQIAVNLVNLPIRCLGDLEFSLITSGDCVGRTAIVVSQRSIAS